MYLSATYESICQERYFSLSDDVCFLSTSSVGFSDGMTLKRHTRKRAKRDKFAGPRAQAEYVVYFIAVDRNDSRQCRLLEHHQHQPILSPHLYLDPDCVIHCEYVNVCDLAKSSVGPNS